MPDMRSLNMMKTVEQLFQAGDEAAKQGAFDDAILNFEAALTKDPQHRSSRYNLAQVLLILGQQQEDMTKAHKALTLLTELMDEFPDVSAYHLQKAKAYGVLRRVDESIALLKSFQGEEAEQAEAIFWLLEMRKMKSRLTQDKSEVEYAAYLYAEVEVNPSAENVTKAREYLESQLQHSPHTVELMLIYYRLWLVVGEIDHAREVLRQLEPLASHTASYHYEASKLCELTHRYSEAKAHCKQALEFDATHTPAMLQLAILCERTNDLAGAERSLEKYVAIMGVNCWSQMVSGLIAARRQDYDLARTLLEAAHQELTINTVLINRLGMVYEKLEKYDEAFDCFSKVKSLTVGSVSTALEQASYAMIGASDADPQLFTPENTLWWGDQCFEDKLADSVFVMGFPRSGTTLMEQVLLAHPAVVVSDELLALNTVVAQLFPHAETQNVVTPDMLSRLTSEEVLSIRYRYHALMAAHIEDYDITLNSSGVLVDKLPTNVFMLGVIQRLFPDAKVLMVLRDPRDAVMSCIKQNFASGVMQYYTRSVEHSVAYYCRMMQAYLHYREVLGLEINEIRYEDFVSNSEEETRRLASAAGLEWNDAMLHYYEREHRRDVSTPSYRGITRPAYKTSIGAWKNYESYLLPYMSALQPFINEFGYHA